MSRHFPVFSENLHFLDIPKFNSNIKVESRVIQYIQKCIKSEKRYVTFIKRAVSNIASKPAFLVKSRKKG